MSLEDSKSLKNIFVEKESELRPQGKLLFNKTVPNSKVRHAEYASRGQAAITTEANGMVKERVEERGNPWNGFEGEAAKVKSVDVGAPATVFSPSSFIFTKPTTSTGGISVVGAEAAVSPELAVVRCLRIYRDQTPAGSEPKTLCSLSSWLPKTLWWLWTSGGGGLSFGVGGDRR
ncbi:hypothetical protein R6Q59_009474 [Mikania micrantha]